MHDAFVSYAVEDGEFASEVAYGLRGNGLKVWFAPLSLRVGDGLLSSIESGLRESNAGVLVLSERFLAKQWTTFEMETLVRQHIEKRKKLLPIWLGVSRNQVEQRSLALAGIIAITDTSPTHHVTARLVEVLSEGARSRGIIPVWEDPARRFLQGLGEVNLAGPGNLTTNIFEFLLHARQRDFPFWLAGRSYTQRDLLHKVSEIIAYNSDRVVDSVGEDGMKELQEMCVENDVDPMSLVEVKHRQREA